MALIRNGPVDILRYLPDFLAKDKNFKLLHDCESREHERLRLALNDLFTQFFIPIAGEKGIEKWEQLIGIIPKKNADIETRRRAVMLWLQSNQVSTVEFMRRLAARYYPPGTDVTIREHNSEYYFELEGSRMPIDCGGLFDALEMYKPAHLGMLISFVLNGGTNLYMGGILSDVLTSGISTAPLPDEAHVPIYMGLVADDIPDGISVGMLSQADVPLVLGLAQSAMFNRIGPANFTPLEPWDLEIAFRQFRGLFATDMDVGRIGSREPISDGSVGNYAGGFVSDTAGRFTPAMGHNADVSNTFAVLFTPKLQRICCDMSDVDKMTELSFLPPSGCSSTALALAGIITEQDTNIQPAALTGTSLSCLAGIITQDLMYRISGKEKEENNEYIR